MLGYPGVAICGKMGKRGVALPCGAPSMGMVGKSSVSVVAGVISVCQPPLLCVTALPPGLNCSHLPDFDSAMP
ncbi:MAG: hypothetical protein BWY76_02782 [bacterium ADurb.Bin429]|nr:MAG: hypothetical protein BWY76_02782 [bacterium ADurb.Bin429]